MRAYRLVARLAGLSLGLFAACAHEQFQATSVQDAGADATCAADSCTDASPSCRSYDFNAGCPSDLTFSGDMTGVVRECTGGQLHVAAKDTLDVVGLLSVTTPGVASSVRISASIAVKDWDGGPTLSVSLDGKVVAELRAVIAASGNPRFSLCGASLSDCAAETFEGKLNQLSAFVLDITSAQTMLSVDCRQLATLPSSAVMPPATLPPKASLDLAFGKTEANPIDGRLDDVVISFQ